MAKRSRLPDLSAQLRRQQRHGIGDLPGITRHLGYLASVLGVDATWINPLYRSGSVDGGYDITDHCDVDPELGCLDDFDALIVAHRPPGKRPWGLDITVPVSFYLPPDDIGGFPPREFVARQYRIAGWTEFPRGGHFMASEEPDLLAADVRKAFRDRLNPAP